LGGGISGVGGDPFRGLLFGGDKVILWWSYKPGGEKFEKRNLKRGLKFL